ncbi:MAG: DUF938 domain-containing protein [Xanthobacteraceae bacterium]
MAEFVVEFDNVGRPPTPDGRLDAPAFHRNVEPIWSALRPFLVGKHGHVLEAGSGTGQHIVEYARRTPDLVWWPSDYSEKHLQSIEAWRKHADLANVGAPFRLDLAEPNWARPLDFPAPGSLFAIFCANVLHIAPWRVAEGLLAAAARELRPDGRLFVYGPFKRDGMHTAPSNARFDASLRAENSEWGVRDIADLRTLARRNAMRVHDIVEMPVNNLVLILARDG